MKKIYTCHKIAEGKVEGDVLFSKDAMCFYLVDPKTGIVIEKEHCLYGQCITGKILVFPYGKASSVVQADGMYQLKLTGMGPAAMIVKDADTTLAASAIIFDVPMANKASDDFYKELNSGDHVFLDIEKGEITTL